MFVFNLKPIFKMKQTIFFFVFLISLSIHSQINLEPGYFIKNNGEKVTCLIKNLDWRNNPTQFEYRRTTDDPVEIATIKSVNMFVIIGKSKYVRAAVNIDRSKKQIQLLSKNKAPDFNEETLFLKTLVEGDANLYNYQDGDLKRFFYSLRKEKIEPLIYKKYRKSSPNKPDQVLENNAFRKQLWDHLKCENLSLEGVRKIDYDLNELTTYFINYNSCVNPTYTNTVKKEKRDLFNLRLRPGITFSSLSLFIPGLDMDVDFGRNINFRAGVEAEFILPFNRNKWSFIIEPTYQAYSGDQSIFVRLSSILTIESDVTANYKSIEVPVGVRHYLYLNDKSKLFINAAFALDLTLNSSIDFSNEQGSLTQDIDLGGQGGNLVLGLGYDYNNKFNFEIRYGFNRQVVDTFVSNRSDFNSFSFIFGYNIF